MRRAKLTGALCMSLFVICGAILAANIYIFKSSRTSESNLPMLFGYGAAAVLSGSMEPAFSAGDLIIVKSADNYEKNDIVVFQEKNGFIVHRIIGLNGDTVTTKGDANNIADEPISVSDIKGKVVFCIPFAGKAVSLIKTPAGTAVIIIIGAALFVITRRKETRKRNEERQKILEEIERLKRETTDEEKR